MSLPTVTAAEQIVLDEAARAARGRVAEARKAVVMLGTAVSRADLDRLVAVALFELDGAGSAVRALAERAGAR